MELQNAIQICRMTNKELDSMINSAYEELIKDKDPSVFSCYYIFEQECSKSYFEATNINDKNTIFLSIDRFVYYHPLYTYLYANYPNMAMDIMRDDCTLCFKELIARLAKDGYKLAIRDTIFDSRTIYEILSFLKKNSYDTKVVAFKNSLFSYAMEMIHRYAISLITRNNDVVITSVTITISMLLDFLSQGLISDIYVKDNISNLSIKATQNGEPEMDFNINKAIGLLEPIYYEQFEKLSSFIALHRRFLTEEEYQDLKTKLDFIKESYYNTLDISLFIQDKGR